VGSVAAHPAAHAAGCNPKLETPVLQVVHRAITRHLLGQAVLRADEADSSAEVGYLQLPKADCLS
jgi:hypothetical protein